MTATPLATDGAVLVQTFTAPGRGLAAAATRRRAGLALAVSTAAALATAAVILPRVDHGPAAEARLWQGRGPGEEPTPFQREQAVAVAGKVAAVAGWSGAALLPSLVAMGAAAALFVGFRVAGTRPGFRETLAVTAHGGLPVWLGALLSLPAVIRHAPLAPGEAGRLLPSSLAALLPASAPPALAGALSALDLFTVWAVALVATGMARAAGASRARAAAVTVILFLAWVAIAKVALPALAGAAR